MLIGNQFTEQILLRSPMWLTKCKIPWPWRKAMPRATSRAILAPLWSSIDCSEQQLIRKDYSQLLVSKKKKKNETIIYLLEVPPSLQTSSKSFIHMFRCGNPDSACKGRIVVYDVCSGVKKGLDHSQHQQNENAVSLSHTGRARPKQVPGR